MSTNRTLIETAIAVYHISGECRTINLDVPIDLDVILFVLLIKYNKFINSPNFFNASLSFTPNTFSHRPSPSRTHFLHILSIIRSHPFHSSQQTMAHHCPFHLSFMDQHLYNHTRSQRSSSPYQSYHKVPHFVT